VKQQFSNIDIGTSKGNFKGQRHSYSLTDFIFLMLLTSVIQLTSKNHQKSFHLNRYYPTTCSKSSSVPIRIKTL